MRAVNQWSRISCTRSLFNNCNQYDNNELMFFYLHPFRLKERQEEKKGQCHYLRSLSYKLSDNVSTHYYLSLLGNNNLSLRIMNGD